MTLRVEAFLTHWLLDPSATRVGYSADDAPSHPPSRLLGGRRSELKFFTVLSQGRATRLFPRRDQSHALRRDQSHALRRDQSHALKRGESQAMNQIRRRGPAKVRAGHRFRSERDGR